MFNVAYQKCLNQKTFNFQSITISSDFDSGNCSNVIQIAHNQFQIWIGVDHQKNNYRTWFYFSIDGINKGTVVCFTIKNMQNQSRLLTEGLVPVYREEGSTQWRRVSEKINLSTISYYDGWIQWTFKHQIKTNIKHYFAFYYPWSTIQNTNFLSRQQQLVKQNKQIYFYRASICRSLQGRPIQFLVLSSNKNRINKQEIISDEYLFQNQKKPSVFINNKPGIVISARVHPGEVPGSHVMVGVIKSILEDDLQMKVLRDQFVFYIFPMLNPDGVSRGHYRVDTNGTNLNRCYINPLPKEQPSIYAIKKIIMHLHTQNRFFAFLDLHAHAARRGTFIYGNCSNQLIKQVKACIFPKLLSMNSIDFQYEGSNFTEKNMYSKDRGDHVSKEGSGRVAMYKVTKNPYCWTMQCNYNMSNINNKIVQKKDEKTEKIKIDETKLDQNLIIEYKQVEQYEAKQYFTIESYYKLGREICETFLDLIQKNPESRIDNPTSYFKNVVNVKMNLAVSLMRMAPNRFQTVYKKIFSGLANSQNTQIIQNSLKALYFLLIKDAKISNINNYVKNGDQSQIVLPEPKKIMKNSAKMLNFRCREMRYSKPQINQGVHRNEKTNDEIDKEKTQNNQCQYEEQFRYSYKEQRIEMVEIENAENDANGTIVKVDSDENQAQKFCIAKKVLCVEKSDYTGTIPKKMQYFKMIKMNNVSLSKRSELRETARSCIGPKHGISIWQQEKMIAKATQKQLPFVIHQKYKEEIKKHENKKYVGVGSQFLFVS